MKATALALITLLVLAGVTRADIVYNNGLSVPTPTAETDMVQAMSTDTDSFALSDDFELTVTVELTGFRFTGMAGDPDVLSPTIGWGILGTSAGVPDTVLYSGTDSNTAQDNYETITPPGSRLYEVEGSFGQTITLSPGLYHFAIKEGPWGSGTGDGSWAYIVFDPATETLGPRGYVSFDGDGTPTIGSQGETATGALAFELVGTVVPEPAAILYLSLGAMIVIARRRR